MTETYTLDGEPLSVCSTNALVERLAEPWVAKLPGSAGYRDAIRAELATRRDWPPTPYERAIQPISIGNDGTVWKDEFWLLCPPLA